MASAEIFEAREAHAYWSQRAASLPWHRRAARREARELASRWRVRLVSAYLESWHLGVLAPFVAPRLAPRPRGLTIRRLLLVATVWTMTVWIACVALLVHLVL